MHYRDVGSQERVFLDEVSELPACDAGVATFADVAVFVLTEDREGGVAPLNDMSASRNHWWIPEHTPKEQRALSGLD